jgi:GT2 family glycosyltransferase
MMGDLVSAPTSQVMRTMNEEKDMSIVLVCWNNKSYLEPCLVSLYEGQLQCNFDVVVVDNGSTDGSQSMLREKYPQVAIIQNDHNVGLALASNQGVEATRGKYVLLLNNDTIVNGLSLDALVAFLDSHPDAGAVGGKLLNPDGSFQGGYADFSSLKEEFLISTGLGDKLWEGYPSHLDTNEIKVVGWLSSACLLLRRATLDQVGLLDERFFIYGDEADLQYRIKQAGWKVYYLPSVTTIHYGGRSMNRWRRRRLVYRGKMLFYRKNYGPYKTSMLRLMLGVLSLAKLIVWAVAYMIPGKRERAKQELDSNLDVIKLCVKLE